MTQSNQHTQGQQHQQTYRLNHGYGSPPRNPNEQRREFLWRERVRLELQMQGLIARAAALNQQWQHLQTRKVALGNQLPKVVGQIVLSGLAGIRQLPGERLYLYEKDRIAQEEYRMQQDLIRCKSDADALEAQINVIDVELSLL